MTVFSDCLTRLAGLFGGGPKPPDCCGDFGGGDAGTDDDDQDDDESCNNSCVDYGFCARSTTLVAYGTTDVREITICYDNLPEEVKLTLDCAAGGEFVDWPEVVTTDGVGSGGDALYQHIAGLLDAAGMDPGVNGYLGGIDSTDCQTFQCDFAFCPTLPTATCPDSSCQDDPNQPGNNIGYFQCNPGYIGAPCRNSCDQVFNIDYNPPGTKHKTLAECVAIGDCCIEPISPGDGPRDVVVPECDLFKCTPFAGCNPVSLTPTDLAALGWDYDAEGCPTGDPTPLINYYETLNGCNTNCPTLGTGDPGIITPDPTCRVWECVECDTPCVFTDGTAEQLNIDLGLGLQGGNLTCGDIFNSLTEPYYQGAFSCNQACVCDSGGGGGGAGPFDPPTGPATPIGFGDSDDDGGGGGGGGGAGSPGSATPIDPREDETGLGSFGNENRVGSDGIRREYASYDSNRVVNPNLSNLPRVRSRNFIPITNRGFRTDIFGSKIHYAIESIDQIMADSIPYSDIPFSELTLANLKDSLSDDLRQRFDSIKSSKGGTALINRILRTIKRKVFEGRIYDLDYAEIITLLDNFEDRDLKFTNRNVSEVAAVNHMIENARTIDVSKFSEAPKEEIRLWKLVAPDVEKHLPILLNDGSLDKVFIDQDDSFDLTLSDGSTSSSYIKDGDVYDLATPGYVAVQYDRDRTVVLDLNDTEKIFNMLGQEYSVVIDVSTLESADIEVTASLTNPRQEVYLLKLDPTSIEDLNRTNDLIRVSKSKYTLMDESEIDEWIQYKPFPFSTFYLDHEDPFFDHLEESEHVFITSKDFALDSFAGYEDDLPILPRRLPWSVAIIPTDRVDLQDGVSRSSLVAINRRSVTFRRNSMKKDVGTNHPLFDFNLVGKGGGAVPDAPTNNQMRFTFNKSKLDNMGPRIKADDKTRKPSPVRELFTALRDAKTEESFIDSRGTTVPWPVVFNKMSVSARKRLGKEIVDYKNFRSKIALNKIASDETIKSKFPKVSNVPVFGGDINLNNYTFKRRVTKIDGSDLRPADIQPL